MLSGWMGRVAIEMLHAPWSNRGVCRMEMGVKFGEIGDWSEKDERRWRRRRAALLELCVAKKLGFWPRRGGGGAGGRERLDDWLRVLESERVFREMKGEEEAKRRSRERHVLWAQEVVERWGVVALPDGSGTRELLGPGETVRGISWITLLGRLPMGELERLSRENGLWARDGGW